MPTALSSQDRSYEPDRVREVQPARAVISYDLFEIERTVPPTHADVVLSLRGITLSFGGVRALSGVDLDVHANEIRSIIGPNGAGKSSLINVISGLYRPDDGVIQIGSQTLKEVSPDRVAKLGIARTFQNIALFKGLTVLENVVAGTVKNRHATFIEQVLGAARARREERDAYDRANAVLDALHLRPLRHRAVGSLPYGLQKRVELARALVAEPNILLLDEPMAGMTAAEKQEMAAFISTARAKSGAAIVLVEHDIGVVMDLSDRVAVLDYGLKIADGTPDEVRNDPRVIDAYLGVAHEDDPALEEAAS